MSFPTTSVEKIIDQAIWSYLVHAPKGLENGPGFINLNKLNKRFALVTLTFEKKKMNCYECLPKQEKKLQNTDIRKNRRLNQAGACHNTDRYYILQTIHA